MHLEGARLKESLGQLLAQSRVRRDGVNLVGQSFVPLGDVEGLANAIVASAALTFGGGAVYRVVYGLGPPAATGRFRSVRRFRRRALAGERRSDDQAACRRHALVRGWTYREPAASSAAEMGSRCMMS